MTGLPVKLDERKRIYDVMVGLLCIGCVQVFAEDDCEARCNARVCRKNDCKLDQNGEMGHMLEDGMNLAQATRRLLMHSGFGPVPSIEVKRAPGGRKK